jgi:hypothetical protein
MRSLIIYPWQVEEFIQWLTPDVSGWALDNVVLKGGEESYEEDVELYVLPALARYDSLKWFEDGRLVGRKNDESTEIASKFKDYRFNGLFYSGVFDTEGETQW